MTTLTPQDLSTIRSYLRHLTRFPDPVTRSYLLNLLHQRCRRPHGSNPERVQKRILKTRHFIEKVRLKIAAANSGHVIIFEELLKEAFARTGKRREELMKSYKETAVSTGKELPHPSCEFPTYPPALAALLISPEAYPGRGRPTIKDLQSIPPNTLITNTWSDLPPDSQPIAPPKSKHMGMLHEARQINHRRWLYDRWLAGLIGPPLSAPPELENCLPPEQVKLAKLLLSELHQQASHRGSPGAPRFSPPLNQPSALKNKSDLIKKQHPIVRIPAQIAPSHPLNPSPPHQDVDPLNEILPKRQRFDGSPPPSPLDLSRGPRRMTKRFIRRRYEAILGEIPILTTENNHHSDLSQTHSSTRKKAELVQDTLDDNFVDRDWITPNFDRSGDHKSYSVQKAGPGLSSFKVLEMSDEDSNWMP